MCGWHQGVLLRSVLHVQVNGPVHGTPLLLHPWLTCNTLQSPEARGLLPGGGAPGGGGGAGGYPGDQGRHHTIQDRFQLRTLAEDDISFISPSEEQVDGELL